MKRLLMAFIVLMLLIPSMVLAQEQKKEPSGFYAGILGGLVIPKSMTVAGTTIQSNGTFSSDKMDIDMKNGFLLGYKVGYMPSFLQRWFALELEYNYKRTELDQANASGDATLLGIPGSYAGNRTFRGKAVTSSLFLNFILRYPDGKIHPYVGFGPGFTQFVFDGVRMSMSDTYRWPSIPLSGTFMGQTSYGGAANNTYSHQFLAGVDFDVTKNVSIAIGYKYYRVNPSFNTTYYTGGQILGTAVQASGLARLDLEYVSHDITIGLNYYF